VNPDKTMGNEVAPLAEYITVADVMHMLSVSERTVRQWIADGDLPAFRAGRLIRVRRSDVLAMLVPVQAD